jgi:hypothetical protein
MDNLNEKLSNEAQSQPSCLGAVRQRISLLPNHKMSDKLFARKADKLANLMVNSMGCEVISKIKYFAPFKGEFWQFQYVA